MPDGRVEYEVRADTSQIGSDLESVGNTLQEKGSKWQSIVDGIGKEIGKGLANMAKDAVQAAWDLGTGFEDGLAKVSTLVDTSTTDMAALGDSLLDISSRYGIAATGLAESAYSAISANNALAEDTNGLMTLLEASAKLSKAGFADVDTAINATLAVMNTYGMGVEEVDRIQKILIQTQNAGVTSVGELGAALSGVTATAANANVSFEEVSAALASITSTETGTSEAVTMLNSMILELSKNGTTASENLAAAAASTEYAGMSFIQMKDAGVPLNEVLNMMQQYAAANNLTMMDMFGSITAGQAALMLTGEAADRFSGNLQTMSEESNLVDEAFAKVSGTTSEQLNQAMAQAQAQLIKVFQAVQPLITMLLQLASTLIGVIASALKPFLEAIKPIITIITELGQVVTSVFGGVIKGALVSASTILKENMDMWKGIFDGLIQFITGVFTGNWRSAWEGVANIFGSIAEGIGNMFKAPINFIIDCVNGFIEGLNGIKIPDWVPGVGGKGLNIKTIPRLKVGMDYVPSDDFPALLHRGEAVLTAEQAKAWRSGVSGGSGMSIDYSRLAQAMAAELRNLQIPVYLDGRQVGEAVEPYVSAEQATHMESMHRSGFL